MRFYKFCNLPLGCFHLRRRQFPGRSLPPGDLFLDQNPLFIHQGQTVIILSPVETGDGTVQILHPPDRFLHIGI